MNARVAVLTPRLAIPGQGTGGAELVAIRLANGLALTNFITDLLVFNFNDLLKHEISCLVNLVDLKMRNYCNAIFKLRRYIKQTKPCVIFAQDNRAAALAILARKLANSSTKIVVTIHSTLSQRWALYPSIKRIIAQKVARSFLLQTDVVVAVSKATAEDLASILHLPRNRIKIIYNPVITPELFVKAEEPLDHPWFRPGEPPVILGVGRLTMAKDFPTLIRAFAFVRKNRSARLMILGEGEDRPKLEALVRELGLENDIALPGFVENPYKYIKRAAVFVLSSMWEGLPTVLIEALALGTPIVSTDCPGGAAEILEGGKWGILVPPKDPQALAGAILQTLESSSNPAPTDAWQRFTVEESVKQYLATIRDVQ